jgi:hypothetical protein
LLKEFGYLHWAVPSNFFIGDAAVERKNKSGFNQYDKSIRRTVPSELLENDPPILTQYDLDALLPGVGRTNQYDRDYYAQIREGY